MASNIDRNRLAAMIAHNPELARELVRRSDLAVTLMRRAGLPVLSEQQVSGLLHALVVYDEHEHGPAIHHSFAPKDCGEAKVKIKRRIRIWLGRRKEHIQLNELKIKRALGVDRRAVMRLVNPEGYADIQAKKYDDPRRNRINRAKRFVKEAGLTGNPYAKPDMIVSECEQKGWTLRQWKKAYNHTKGIEV
jgi:hypothetical protein